MRYQKLLARLHYLGNTRQPDECIREIIERVPGWSGFAHYYFFTALMGALLESKADAAHMLMLGVYRGRDLSFIADIIRRNHQDRVDAVKIIGVDKFSDTPCRDWPEEKLGKDWIAAGFGPPPSIEEARKNIGEQAPVTLVQANDEDYLRMIAQAEWYKFDAIYIDTSHDYETVARQIRQCRPLLKPDGILCGDDYLEDPQWGVIRGVNELCPERAIFASCWAAPAAISP